MHCVMKGSQRMKLMIDTNIILNVLLEQEPFFVNSQKVLRLCEEKRSDGFITASTITDLFYIIRKATGSVADTYKIIGHILNIVKVLPVTGEDVNQAFLKKAKDFEDCLLAVCAQKNQCDAIVTRNSKDFSTFGITILSPEELLERA